MSLDVLCVCGTNTIEKFNVDSKAECDVYSYVCIPVCIIRLCVPELARVSSVSLQV